MAKNEVKLTFAGDAAQLDKTLKDTGKNLDGFKAHAEDASKGTRDLGENLETGQKKFRGAADAVDGLSGVTAAFGLTLPGPIGGILTFSRGMADLADGIGTTVLPALKAMKVSMLATLGPWGLAAVAVAALVAGFVIAYKKSETFRNAVHALGAGVKAAFDLIKKAGDIMVKGLVGYAKLIVLPYKLAFNGIADAWNNTAGRISFHIPGWVPGIGGNGFSVPQIPHFAAGGVSPGGPALVGERGPEVVDLPAGSVVHPHGTGSTGQPVTLVVQGPSDDLFVQWFRKQVRVKGGGNVQVAFGR